MWPQLLSDDPSKILVVNSKWHLVYIHNGPPVLVR
uniref:Uncharacterized protein n=1 Tax=Arundo donax TaxID=35708 RepID=A0A0A9CAT5_ARUDO